MSDKPPSPGPSQPASRLGGSSGEDMEGVTILEKPRQVLTPGILEPANLNSQTAPHVPLIKITSAAEPAPRIPLASSKLVCFQTRSVFGTPFGSAPFLAIFGNITVTERSMERLTSGMKAGFNEKRNVLLARWEPGARGIITKNIMPRPRGNPG